MPDHHPDNELALLLRIADGDARAFESIYRRYSPTVYNTAKTYVKDGAEAEEIVQQVFLKLWERRTSLSAVESFADYIFIIVRNSLFDHFNQLSRRTRLVQNLKVQAGEWKSDEADHRFRLREVELLVEKAIRQLPDRQKQVYLMADGEALDYDDIASRMQISRLTAKKHMELARKAIRKYLYRHLQDYAYPLLPILFPVLLHLLR